MKKKISILLFAMVCLFGLTLMPVRAQAANKIYYVTKANLNLRAGAGTKYKTYFTIPKNDTVQIINTNNSKWYRVQYQNSSQKKYIGYVDAKYLKKPSLYKTKCSLNLRKYGSNRAKIVTAMPKNATVIAVVKTSGSKWWKVTYYKSNGKVYRGYCSKNYLKATSLPSYYDDDDDDDDTPSETVGYTFRATTAVYLRSGASNTSSIVLTVPSQALVTVTAVSGNWYQCAYNYNGVTYSGFINKSYLLRV